MSLPIVVGVTGHRDIRTEDIQELKKIVRNTLEDLKNKYPDTDIVMLNSIATGADTLCANVAIDLGIPLVCPLPMEINEYRRDFSGTELDAFGNLLKKAARVFVAPTTEPEISGRDFRYRQAGIYVASHCHVLMALWNGKEGSSGGCGTAEAVGFMLREDYRNDNMIPCASEGTVIHIMTRRQSDKKCVTSGSKAGPYLKLIENEAGSFEKQLQLTNSYNNDAKSIPIKGPAWILKDAKLDSDLEKIRNNYVLADALSFKFQNKYLHALAALSTFCVVLVLCYLFYDEAGWNWTLPVFGGVIILYYLIFRLIKNGRSHEKYLFYRQLAETLRVQLYLSALGIHKNIAEEFTWTERHDSAWIKKAVAALLVGETGRSDVTPEKVRDEWIAGQLQYHNYAYKKNKSAMEKAERISQAMLIGTVILYLIILILEYAFPTALDVFWITVQARAWMKIFWGTLSAVTLFVSGYYGRLSLERKCYDNEKMADLFETAAAAYDAAPEKYEKLFIQLAKEEIIENGNWMSYCRENRPTFSL